jgi:ribosomal protein S18 acetylase RimI-like enzyme
MELADYENIIALWQESEGVKLRDADSEEGIKRYLDRNPGLSFVCENNGYIIGTIMSGHDGKRGYVQHLAVAYNQRGKGIASELISRCLEALRLDGIIKSHIHVLSDNQLAKQYWSNREWEKRNDIEIFSFINGESAST